ncbi:uncharacterized protein LOC143695417 isoform X2 [Agelaius phoeniceus]|uniref:uncharacterized protein LOC143695417 isoform X2 n=1 Tax=Agelaius phoeniceus TaxID=39638 RepID=UPI004054AE55
MKARFRWIKSVPEGPIPGEGIPPSSIVLCLSFQEVKAESSSQGQVGEVVRLQSILAEHIRARCCRCPRHAKERRRAGIFWAASGVKSRFEVPRGGS